MTYYSPRMREILGYVDTNGDGVTDAPPATGGTSSPVDLSSYAKKTEVAPKADKTYVDAELTKKANASSLAAKADTTYVDTKVAEAATGGAVDLSSYAKAADVNAKADKTYVDAELAKKANASSLAAKADTTYVDAELAKKANSSSLAAKADKTYVDTELSKKADKSVPTVTGMAVQGGKLVLTYSNGFTDSLTLPTSGGTTDSSTPQIVPLSLSVGQTDYFATGTAQAGREFVAPMKWGADISRFKIHIQHINPRTGTTGDDTPFVIKGVGVSAGGTLSSEKSLEISGTAKGASDFSTDWIDYKLTAGTEYGIRMTYTGSSTAKIIINPGGSYITSNPASIWAYNGLPFHIWIEAETPATTKIYTFAGDSLTAGVGATMPVYDSWPYQLTRTQGVLPVLYAASGSTFDEWIAGASYYPLALWDDARFAKGDVLFENMGSNNIFTGNSLSAMQTKAKSYTTVMKGKVKTGAPVVTTAILPRNSKPATDATEVNRKSYNDWLATKPTDIGAKKHIDFISVVSSDNDNIPTEKTSDGTHLTTAAYGDVAASVNTQWSKSETVPATFTA